jgi:hypothetical protein
MDQQLEFALTSLGQPTMRFPLIGKDRSIFMGNLRLFWIYFYRNRKRTVGNCLMNDESVIVWNPCPPS